MRRAHAVRPYTTRTMSPSTVTVKVFSGCLAGAHCTVPVVTSKQEPCQGQVIWVPSSLPR
jgi:hypothetical protein